MVADEYDFWILDLDGTLVDVEPGYTYDVFDRVGARLGYDFTERQADILWHGLGGPRNDQLERWNIPVERFWEVFHEEEDGEARADHTYLYADAEFLAELDVPVGLVTHSQQYLADPVLDRLGIRDWFDSVVCCTNETGWKPDPRPVRMAMNGIGAEGEGVLAGDGPQDVEAAWNAGLDGIHVERHGHERRGMCVLADHRIRTFDDLWAQSASD